KKLCEFVWEISSHPQCSPNIAPSDYHLFRALQHYLFNIDSIRNNIEKYFDEKPNSIATNITALSKRCREIVKREGNYILP
ncbi:hypothetical protein WH47_08475, partial [Habropoda laboriosa]